MKYLPPKDFYRTRFQRCIAGRLHLRVAIAFLAILCIGIKICSIMSFNISSQCDCSHQPLKDMDKVARQSQRLEYNIQFLNVHDGERVRSSPTNNSKETSDSVAVRDQLTTASPTVPKATSGSSVCEFPEIDPFDPSMERYLDRSVNLNCSSNVPNVVYLKDEVLLIDFTKVEDALSKLNSTGDFKFCQYKVLQRKPRNDFEVNISYVSAKFNESIRLRNLDEDIRVECFDTKDEVISRSYFTIMRLDPEKELTLDESYKVHIDKNAPVETLSILMIGIDGLAKQHFARAMPKTRSFLIKELGALEMNKHGKLGYSTLPNVLPLLSGRTVDELENDKKWKFNRWGWMNQINEALIWSDARRLGYRTALMIDVFHITAFHYLRKGFHKKPVDHYMRPLIVDSIFDPMMRVNNPNCFGDEPEITKLYDYWLQLLHLYNSTKTNQTPFFAYSFLTRLTHDDYNMAFAGDELYLKFLKDLKATNALNNTVIIWFSDHGERYGPIRETFTGEIETNTPFLFFAFPPWFEKKYPEVMRVFRTNQNRLTSHFDTYATMQDLINFKGVVGPKGELGERSISYFRDIPNDRTCEDAQIPAEFCLCSGLSKANLAPGLEKYLGAVIKNNVNFILEEYMDMCEELSLRSVERVLEEKLKDSESDSEMRNFRVSIVTEPGKAQFEARVRYDVNAKRAEVDGEIVRTNMYRGQGECMNTAELRSYCYCKKIPMEPA